MLRFQRRNPRRAAAVIISMGMLLVLAVLAVSFARIMVPERDGARNFALTTHARFASHAGIEAAFARLRSDAPTGVLDDIGGEWRYFGEDANRDFVSDVGEDVNVNGLVERDECPIAEAVSPSYQVSGQPYSGLVDVPGLPSGWTVRYKLRVVDSQSMVNLNENKAWWWYYQHLGIGIKKHLAMSRDVIGQMRYGGKSGHEALLLYRDTLPGRVFTDRKQLVPILEKGEADLAILAPYVTTNSWRDVKTYREANGEWEGPANLVSEPTYPVNINTATRPVINAVISGAATWFTLRSTQSDSRIRDATGKYYGFADHQSRRFRAYSGSGNYDHWSWRHWGWAWYWETWEEGFETWTPPIHQRRIGQEVDSDGSGAAEAGEDTNGNGNLDSGPFRSSQDWSAFVTHYDGVDDEWWESMRAGLNPEGMVNRYNPEWVPCLGFDDADGVRKFYYENYGSGDRTRMYRNGPTWCFRSHGYFEVESLGEVVDADGNVVARYRTDVDARVFYPLVQTSQKDFLSAPEPGKTWKTNGTYPSLPWSAQVAASWLGNQTTYPENIWDNANGSADATPSKADEFLGGIHAGARGYSSFLAGPDCLFAADFKSSFDAEKAAPGTATPTVGKNINSGGAAATRVRENTTVGKLRNATASDLYIDGLYVDPFRGRHCTYANPDFANVQPDEGSLEFWWKPYTLHYPGDLFTAIFPGDPSVETGVSTEGSVLRVYLAYIACQTTDFQWFLPWLLPFKSSDRPIRFYNWAGTNVVDVMTVPVLVAERIYYTAVTDMETGLIHGRAAGGLRTLGPTSVTDPTAPATYGSFGNGTILCTMPFAYYELYPLTNWAKDKMWHHVAIDWADKAATGGAWLSLYVDGVKAPYQTTVVPDSNDVCLPFWDLESMVPEIHVGGISMTEVPRVARTYAPTFVHGSDPALVAIKWPDPQTYSGGYNSPYRWTTASTIDSLRIYSDPTHVMSHERYFGGPGYFNVVQFPTDATKVISISFDQQVPLFDPDNYRDDTYKHGLYLRPEERPYVELELFYDVSFDGTPTVDFNSPDMLTIRPDVLKSQFGMTDEEAALAARSGGIPLDREIAPNEQWGWDALFHWPDDVAARQTTPILESVTFFYVTRTAQILRWEEVP